MAHKITNLTDARYFAALEVEWMSFALDPKDESHISLEDLKAIWGWLDGPQLLGDFGTVNDLEWMEFMVKELSLDGFISELDVKLSVPHFHIDGNEGVYRISTGKESLALSTKANLLSTVGFGNDLSDELLKEADGLMVEGSFEEQVGLKSFDALDALFERLEHLELRTYG